MRAGYLRPMYSTEYRTRAIGPVEPGAPPRSRRLAVLIVTMMAIPASAHPLGNDNVEHASILWLLPDRLEVDFLLFIAENPSTRIEQQEMDRDGDDVVSTEEQRAWLTVEARRRETDLFASLDGRPLPLKAVEDMIDPATGKTYANRVLIKMPGFAGMPTYRLLIRYVARFERPLARGPHVLDYEDRSYEASPGLKRILLEPMSHLEFLPPHPEFWSADPFKFEQYDPANLPQERSAKIRFNVVATATAPAAAGPGVGAVSSRPEAEGLPGVPQRYAEGLTSPVAGVQTKYQVQANKLMELLQGRWGLMVFLMVTGLSFTWGAAHALMPGHAKTVVAAYLISQSGTYWHAVLLAIVVTITHTALVVVLGAIWAFYQATNPALGPKLQLWLGLISGLLVAGMGLTLIWRACRGSLAPHHHDHEHDRGARRSWLRRLFTHSHPQVSGHERAHVHNHGHDDHEHAHEHLHAHGHEHHHHDARPVGHERAHGPLLDDSRPASTAAARPLDSARVTGRLILMLGVTGGIVPCPTATIIMLLGIGANVVMGALYAVAVFSLGLALTLMVIGFLALSSRRFAARLMSGDDQARQLSATGRLILLRVVPAVSGLAVVLLGVAIAANYVHYMWKGTSLITWMG